MKKYSKVSEKDYSSIVVKVFLKTLDLHMIQKGDWICWIDKDKRTFAYRNKKECWVYGNPLKLKQHLYFPKLDRAWLYDLI